MKQTLHMRQQLSINLRYCYSSSLEKPHKICRRPAIRLPTWLIAVSSHCLTTLPAKIPAFNSYMRQNAYYRDLKCIFADLLPCYCYTTNANRPVVEQFAREFRNMPPQQGYQFGFFEAKFVIFGLFSTPLAFFAFFYIFGKRPNEIWLFWPCLANSIFYVDLAHLKMVLADFWALADL